MTQPRCVAHDRFNGGVYPCAPGHGASRERAREMCWVFALARERGRDRAGDWDDRGGETNPRRPRREAAPEQFSAPKPLYTNPAQPCERR